MQCVGCGAPNVDHANVCASCGRVLPQQAAPPQGAQHAAYAGFWRRAAAYVIDYFVLVGTTLVLNIVFAVASARGVEDPRLPLLYVLAAFLYFTLLESSKRQATLGKLAVGIRVTDTGGRRIGFGRAAGRFAGRIVSGLMLGIGYLLAAVTPRRQALHDLIAGTLVVRRDAANSPIAGWAVALIVLAGAVPLAAIFAAIALPAYRDYSVRAQVAEGLSLAAAHRSAVEAEWNDRRLDLPSIDSRSVRQALPRAGKHVESVEIEAGIVYVTYGAAAHELIAGSTLAIVPAVGPDGMLAWICGRASAPAGFTPVVEAYGIMTTVPDGYLPSGCRPARPSGE